MLFSGGKFTFGGGGQDTNLVERESRWRENEQIFGLGGVHSSLPSPPPPPLRKTLTIRNSQILLYCFNKIIKGPGTSFQAPALSQRHFRNVFHTVH